MAITKELKRVYASAPIDEKYVETLEFSHPNFTQTRYFTNDERDWTFLLEDKKTKATFLKVPFVIVLPKNDAQGAQDLQINIDNVGQEMVDELEAANANPREPITAVLRIYLDIPLSLPQNDPVLSLSITGVAVKRDVVTATATRSDILNRRFPNELYRGDRFPGLVR